MHAFVLSWLQSLCLMRFSVECPLDLKKRFYYQRYQSKFTCFTVCLCIFQNYSSLDVYPLQLIKSIEVQGPDKPYSAGCSIHCLSPSHHNSSNLTMFFISSTDSYLTTCVLYRDIHLSFCQLLIGLKSSSF